MILYYIIMELNSYKSILVKLTEYVEHVDRVINLSCLNNELDSVIYGSKFGLIFKDPCSINDFCEGTIGGSNNNSVRAYYFNKSKLDYIEFVCDKTNIKMTNENVAVLGLDITPMTLPFINIFKMQIILNKYICFYKKLISEFKPCTKSIKNINKKEKLDNVTIGLELVSDMELNQPIKTDKCKKELYVKPVLSSSSSSSSSSLSSSSSYSKISKKISKFNVFKIKKNSN